MGERKSTVVDTSTEKYMFENILIVESLFLFKSQSNKCQ